MDDYKALPNSRLVGIKTKLFSLIDCIPEHSFKYIQINPLSKFTYTETFNTGTSTFFKIILCECRLRFPIG